MKNLWTRVKKSESYSVNLHDGFPGKSMKNVPNIRLFSRIYTKKIHLSYFTFDSVLRTSYTYNSIKKNNRFRFVFNSNINQKYIGKVLVHELSWTFMNIHEFLWKIRSWIFVNIHEHSWKIFHKYPCTFMNKKKFMLISNSCCLFIFLSG